MRFISMIRVHQYARLMYFNLNSGFQGARGHTTSEMMSISLLIIALCIYNHIILHSMLFLSSVINITLHVLRNCVWTSKLKHSYLFFSKGCLSCLFLNPIEYLAISQSLLISIVSLTLLKALHGPS